MNKTIENRRKKLFKAFLALSIIGYIAIVILVGFTVINYSNIGCVDCGFGELFNVPGNLFWVLCIVEVIFITEFLFFIEPLNKNDWLEIKIKSLFISVFIVALLLSISLFIAMLGFILFGLITLKGLLTGIGVAGLIWIWFMINKVLVTKK